jgi:hypothetical protein
MRRVHDAAGAHENSDVIDGVPAQAEKNQIAGLHIGE